MLKQFQHLVFELMNGEYETLKSIQGDKVEQRGDLLCQQRWKGL